MVSSSIRRHSSNPYSWGSVHSPNRNGLQQFFLRRCFRPVARCDSLPTSPPRWGRGYRHGSDGTYNFGFLRRLRGDNIKSIYPLHHFFGRITSSQRIIYSPSLTKGFLYFFLFLCSLFSIQSLRLLGVFNLGRSSELSAPFIKWNQTCSLKVGLFSSEL